MRFLVGFVHDLRLEALTGNDGAKGDGACGDLNWWIMMNRYSLQKPPADLRGWHGCKGVIYVHLYFGRWSKMVIGYLLFARCSWKYQDLCHEAPVRICTMAPIASCATPVTTTAFLKPHAMIGRMKRWSLVVFRVLGGRRWFWNLLMIISILILILRSVSPIAGPQTRKTRTWAFCTVRTCCSPNEAIWYSQRKMDPCWSCSLKQRHKAHGSLFATYLNTSGQVQNNWRCYTDLLWMLATWFQWFVTAWQLISQPQPWIWKVRAFQLYPLRRIQRPLRHNTCWKGTTWTFIISEWTFHAILRLHPIWIEKTRVHPGGDIGLCMFLWRCCRCSQRTCDCSQGSCISRFFLTWVFPLLQRSVQCEKLQVPCEAKKKHLPFTPHFPVEWDQSGLLLENQAVDVASRRGFGTLWCGTSCNAWGNVSGWKCRNLDV